MTNPTACRECGMSVAADEYHPYAACLMFKACHDSTKVRANLQAAIDHGRRLETAERNTRAPEGEAVALLTMAYRAGFIEACQWPEPVSQDCESKAFALKLRTFIEKHTPLYTHPLATSDEVERSVHRNLLAAAKTYYTRYCVDEADDDAPNVIGCSHQQSIDAQELRDAIDAALAKRGEVG